MNKKSSKIESIKGTVALLREILIVGGILILIISPKAIKRTLKEAGIKSIAGIEFIEDLEKSSNETKKAINDISVLRDSLDILKVKLAEAIDQSNDPDTKKELASIQSTIKTTTEKADNLGENLRNSFSRQEQLIDQYGSSAKRKKEIGWIFLGKTDENQKVWDEGNPKTIAKVALPLQSNTLLKITTDTYLREDSNTQKSRADILSVVKEGETVEVVDVDSSHAIGGGWFLWAKIKR
jgi:hypothetical protein